MASLGVCLDSGQNQVDCGDPCCSYGDCIPNPTPCTNSYAPPAAGSTVSPNPSVPPTSSAASASSLSQLGNTMGQWGATIASIATGTPTVVTSSGAKVGTTAVAPVASNTTLILILAVVAVVIVFAMEK